MSIGDLAKWLEARKLDLHWSRTGDGEVCLTAIRGGAVWNGVAARIDDAIELLKANVEANWRLG